MSAAVIETHAELERRRRHEEPTRCPGRMIVVDQDGDVWVFECDRCGFEAGRPAREVAPSQYAAQLVEQRRERSGIPPKLRGMSLPTDNSERSRALRQWAAAEAEHPALLLCGDVGVGKTCMAAGALWERAKVGPVRWIYVPALFSRLALAFSDEERHDALREISGTETIVLDDIDKSPPKQFAGDELLCAIEMRLAEGAGVLVTTNLRPSALADRYPGSGHAIVSRLRGQGETFLVGGPDRRSRGSPRDPRAHDSGLQRVRRMVRLADPVDPEASPPAPAERSAAPMTAVLVDLEELVERVALRVAELLEQRGHGSGPRLVDAGEMARILGCSRSTIYDRAAELGAVQLGDGTRPRLRFDPEKAREAWTRRVSGVESQVADVPAPGAVRRRRRRDAAGSGVPLLPIKARGAA